MTHDAEDKRFIYDERIGCVAVYEAPKRECLSLPTEQFLFYSHFAKDEHGWVQDDDACSMARRIANKLNDLNTPSKTEAVMVEALQQIANGQGPYKINRLEFATSTIKNLTDIAEAALALVKETQGQVPTTHKDVQSLTAGSHEKADPEKESA